jgi:hypothetical protein
MNADTFSVAQGTLPQMFHTDFIETLVTRNKMFTTIAGINFALKRKMNLVCAYKIL